MFRRWRQLPPISTGPSKEESLIPCVEPCKPSTSRRIASKSSCESIVSTTASRAYTSSFNEDDVHSDSDSSSSPSINKDDCQQQAIKIQPPSTSQATTGFRRKVFAAALQASQPMTDSIVPVSDLHGTIRDVSATTEVAYVCSREQSDKVSMLGTSRFFSDEDSYEFPEVLIRAAATIFIVEDSEACVDRANAILKNESGSMTGAISVLLMRAGASAGDDNVVEAISSLMEAGADDVTILPENSVDWKSTISVSLSKAAFSRRQREHLKRKIAASRSQCQRLFWQVAHEIVEGMPQVRENCCEVYGKSIGNIDIISKVGQGAFCEVYQCRNAQDKKCVVKIFKKHEVSSLERLGQLLTEHELLRRLTHPNIVRGINLVHGNQNMYLFMEMVGTTNLFQLIKSQAGEGVPWPNAKEVLLHIFRGGAYMHDMNIAHCDLKPENIVISAEGCAKLIDFGEAIDVGDGIQELKRPRGTMPFMAPEILLPSRTWDPILTDLWSFGVILVEVLCGNHSFAHTMKWKRNPSSLSDFEKCADELSIVFGKDSKDAVFDAFVDHCRPPPIVRPMLVGLLELVPTNRMLAKDVVTILENGL
mmetsp:Transcript_51786/g.80896  ORF Transcript_51786/g.80896 Transcript_51786/m.80896 type:complete len:591 (+) Transcript_51786:45-1817(+)|eukprot:CAMPEP_0169125666 /NCGR_PEP_ID=MMETSP1015-20121227/35012_1 /TAXON_ID=342587 /ORGANISM="Karlodinium micrum, Strain CCMP2283" /LENGTH=590 /DNA_ID=CAMNT_0009189229 /DNA_START=95 /DNA_END=1867 /DNA_ORIENTATION=+